MNRRAAAQPASSSDDLTSILLLFDIDGTLLDTRGAGLRAMIDAAGTAFDVPEHRIPELDLAGSTDSGILRSLLPSLGIVMSERNMNRFYGAYLEALEQELKDDNFTGELLPGVNRLLGRLESDPRISLGLLTGNIETGARLKLQRFGLSHYFPTGAFGDDHHDRDHLGPIALERMEAVAGKRFLPAEIAVIGDTPRDIACARALGARSVCVATGSYDYTDLEQHGPDLLFEDLSDTIEVQRKLSFIDSQPEPDASRFPAVLRSTNAVTPEKPAP